MRSSKKRRTVRAVLAAILSVAMAVSGVPTNALAEAAREVSGQSDGWEMPDEQVTSEQLRERENESVPEEESTGSSEQPQEQTEQDVPEPSGEDPPAGDEQVPEPADEQVPEEEAPDGTYVPEEEVSAEGENSTEERNTEDTLTFEDNSIKVTATLADASALPAGTELVVTPVTPTTDGYDYDAYMGALNDSVKKENPYNEKNTLLYDVSFVAADEEGKAIEVEPAEGTVTVNFEFKQQQLSDDLGAKKADDVTVTHLPESDGKIEVEKIADATGTGEEQIEITTDSFSVYAFSYTVDFTYDDFTYSIAGETNILLSKLFEILGIEEDVADVKDVTFTNTDFVKVEKKGDDWLLTSLKPFTSDETLTVELFNGAKYVIAVTDAQAQKLTETFEESSFNLDIGGQFNPYANFGLVAFDSLELRAHTNSNFATKHLTTNVNAGTRIPSPGEVFYIGESINKEMTFDLNANTGGYNGSKVVFGKDILLDVGADAYVNGGQKLTVNGPSGDQLRDVVVSESDDKKFIDLSAWQQAVAALSADFMRFPSTQISKQQSTSSDYVLFVERTNASVASLNLDASDLTAKIKIDDRAVSDRSHIMIINIDAKGQDSVALPGLEIEPNTDGNGIAYTGELHDRWTQGNFVINVVDSTQQDGMFRGTFTTDGATSASIIAPYGTVVAAQNVNGIILAENIKVIAEFHRDSITYTNKITVKGGLKAAKEVNGSRETDQTFDFVLESIDGSPMPEGAENGRLTAQNELDGMIIFGYLDFATAGDYRYKLYEDVPVDGVTLDDGRVLKSGIVYDPTQYIVVVHATDSGTGIGIGGYTIYDASTNKEIKTITYDEGKTGVVTFENSTASGTAYIKATKQFSSGWPEGQTFQFKLTGKNFIRENGTDGGVPGMWDIVDKPSGAGTVIDYSNNSMTVTVSENSPTVVFGGLNLIQNGAIQQDRLGTYTYTIQEVIPAGADYSADRTIATKDGIVYDAREHTVAVKAIKSGNEYAVVVLYDGTDSKLTVTNTNTNYEIGKLTVLKHVSPDDAASSAGEDAEFKVTVTNADGQYINADGSTSTNKVELTVTPRTPLVIEGLALRTTYTVTETGQATVNRWHYTATGSTITGSATLDAENKEATVNLTNNYEQYGSLNVSKSVTGDGSTIEGISSKPFTIYVEKDGTYYWMGTSGIESGTTKTGSTIIGQGSVTLAGLPLGTYNVTEDEAGAKVDGYSLDVTTGSAIVTADETANVAVTNNYTKQADNKTSVSGTKTWLDGGKNHDNANEVTLTLKRTSSKYTTPQAVTATPAWNGDTYTFANLDKNDDEGNPYTYEVTEGAINGYTSTKVEGTNNFVNKSDEKVSVSVEKIWNDSNNQDQKRPTSITVRLHAGSEQVGSEITLSESDQWKHTWSDLYKYDQTTGAAIVYTVTEDEVSNYSTQITQKDNSENSYVVTNSYTPGQTSVTVEKEWIDGDNAKRTRPASVSVQLLADGEASGGPVTLDASKNWEYTWTGLPEKKDGKAIVYTVSEEQVNGYAAPEITGSAEQGFVIKNKLSGTVEVSGTKTWLDGGKTHDNAKEITLTLKRKSAKPDSVEESVEASATWTNNTYTFGSQPKYDDYGYEYTYTVSEREIEGYSTTQDGYNITNTIEPAGVTITKQWNDFANEDHSRPTADSFKAKLNLFAKVGEGQSIEVTDVYANDLTVTDNSNGTYTATWANLPQVDENGQSIVYTVTEDSITGYTSSTNDPISDGGTLINTHMPTIDIRGHKVWDDEESAKETTRKPITVQLQSRNGDGAEWANVEGRTAVPSGEDLSFAFEALPKYYGNTTDTLIQYQVVETEVPAGYTATDGNASNGYTITNSLKKGERVLPVELTIHKTDDKNVNLPGAVYEVTATGETQTGSECGEYTTDSDGKAFVTFTTPGTWKLEEKTAPAGYLLNDAEYVIVVNQSGDVEVKLEEDDVWTWIYHLIFGSPQLAEGNVLNVTDAPTRVSVSKTDIANGEEVDGATIQIIETVKKEDGTTEEKVVEQWVSGKVEGEEGPHLIEGLKTGVEYTLRETVAPDGYAVATDTTFTIDETGKVTTTGSISEGGVLLVEDAKTKVSVSKTDITGEEELKGAHIQIIDSEGKVVELDGEKLEWDSDGSAHVVEGLKTGIEYTLRETVAPEGYTIATDTTFTIDERGKVKVGDTVVEDNHVLIKDAKTKVKVSKTDIADGEEVEGATIQIIETVKKEDGTTEEKVVEQWVSGKVEGEEGPHLIEGLKTGVEYTLRETVAPDGYAVATDTTFTIDERGKVTTTGTKTTDGEGNTVLLVEDAKTKVTVSKTDIANGEELEGAQIQIVDSEGKVVEKWTSTDEPHVIEGLKTGEEYTLRETVAPDGYAIATETKFTIDERGKVTTTGSVTEGGVLLIEDALTRVSISKVDVDGGAEIPGAKIQILNQDDEVAKDIHGNKAEWTSTTQPHVVEGLKAGTYTLHEVIAPNGYTIATDTTFTIDKYGKVTTESTHTTDGDGNTILLVQDARTEVKVSKVDIANDVELPGATIVITDSEGTIADSWVSAVDDSETEENEAIHVIRGLKTGELYTMTETVAPDGYKIATAITFTIDTDGKVTVTGAQKKDGVILIKDAPTTFTVSKTAIAGSEELAGAELQILVKDENDEYKVAKTATGEELSWTSGDTAKTITGLKTGVEYTLRETVAPAGYTIATEITFTLDQDGNVIVKGKAVEGNALLIQDALTAVKVAKTDIANGEELEGATIQVLDGKGEVVTTATGERLEWTSTTEPKLIEGLTAGTEYTLRETVAPEGYDVTTDIKFTIDEAGKVTTTGKTTTDAEGKTVFLVEDAKPAIEKYVNKDVHSDLDAFDSTFTYDILAFVTGDADKVEIYDELIGNINFTQGVEVKVADMGTTNDHKANGTVDTDGDPVEANAAIEGKNLKVTINDAKSLRNHWVKVTFTAKLNNAEGAVSTWAEYEDAKKAINNNGTVISEIAKHRGIDNKASYKVFIQTDGTETPDDTSDDKFEDRHERESNVVTVTPKTTTLQVQKKWTNNKGKELSWPAGAEVTVELLFDGAPTNNIKALTASETSATFANLPVYEGKQYGVAEASVVGVPAGFITTVAGSAADGFVITNSEAGPEVEKYVNKDVHADLNAFDTTFNYDILAYVTADATSVTITDELVAGVEFANGADTRVTVVDLGEENDHTAFGTVSKNGSNVEATPTINGNKLEVEIPDARSYRNHWVKVTYMAKLNNGAVGNWSQYETAAQQIPGNGTVVSTAFANGHKGVPNTARYAVYTAKSGEGEGRKPTYEDETNTVTVTPKTTEVSVDKKWLNAEREDMAWPADASIEVELLQGKDVYDTKTLASATPVTFTDLPVYENAAKQYSVREKVVPEGYTAEVTGTAAAGYTITNTMKSQDVKITKAWDDFSNEDNKRPSAKDFAQYLHLWANDVDVTSTYASKLTVADKGNTYEAQWTGLPAMDGMMPVVYQVSEDKVPGYAAVTQGRVDANGTITNKHVVKTTVSGQKQWADDASKATSTRPESITVNLLQNDAKIDSASVKPNENGEWLFSFEDLDKYDENGEPYTYTVTEDEVKGYTPTVASDATRGFVITNEIVDHRDDEAPVELTVRKKDAEDESLKLAGAEFTLTRTDKENVTPVVATTGEDGTATFTFAESGTWSLKETKAPAGYTLSDKTIQIEVKKGEIESVTYDEGNAVWSWLYNLVFSKPEVTDNVLEVEDGKTAVNVSKTDIAGGPEVAGAHIQILDADQHVVTEWDSEEGKTHAVKGLTTGVTYTLRETVAPAGYTIATNTIFQLNADGTVATLQEENAAAVKDAHTVLVEDAKTVVKVSKVDIANGEEVAGATIQIIDSKGEVVEQWTSAADNESTEDVDEGIHTIEGLKAGEQYTLRETVAPEGYTIATDTTFTIDENGKVKIGDTVVEDNHVLIKDAKTKVKVSKTDIASGEELEGAQIQIIDSKGKVVEKWTSTKDNESTDNVDESVHVIEGLKTGEEYTLRETVAPDGYAVATDTTFTIDEKGKVTTTGSVTEDGVLLVEDALTKVSVSKVAVGGGEELAGAKIQLMHENAEGELEVVQLGGNDVEWTSEKGKAHEIVGLKAGDYVLHETVAPAGYAIATDIAFTLNADGTVTTKAKTSSSGAILIEDALTTVSIKKTDIADGFELPGAKMKVVYAGDNGEEEVFDQWVSGEEAHEVKGLVAGVVYTLREVVAPAGYAIATETTFALNADGTIDASKTSTKVQDGELLVEDAKTKITVSKTDITGEEELKGAHMQVLNASGEVVVLGGEKLEWNSDGSAHVITGLKTGVKYTLRETVAPEGYTIATDTEFVIREDGSVTIGKETIENNHILIKDAKNRVLVSKTDITGDEELEGARLRVLDSKGVEVDAWTTKKDQTGTVKHLIEGLKVGETYTLREEVAPDGYTVATDTTFTVDEKGNVSTKGATTTDGDGNTVLLVKDAKTKVKVAKTDVTDADNHEIAGAHIQIMAKGEGDELEVVKLDGKPLEWISEEGASREVVGLTAGIEYTLRETVAPAGYAIATDVTFTIQPDGTVKASAPVTKDGVILVQDAITEVSISKHDVTNDKELAGATIQILDGDGKVVELKRGNKTEKLEWVSTTEAHVIKGLATGVEYTLHEETAPKGYKVAADTTFKINADGTVETKGATIATASGKTVLLVNDAMTTVKVSKTDVTDEDNHELAGATIQILYTDASGKEQEFTSWTSTNEAHEVVGLEAGVEYILRETVAPDGYTIASDTKFSIDKDGTVKSGGTTVQDGHLLVKDALTKVSVSKKAVGGEDELPGAKIQILDGDGEVVELKKGDETERLEWTSGTEAKEIEGLKTGVTYTLRETVAPDGYTVASDIEFVIEPDGTVKADGKQVKGGALLIEDALTKVSVSKKAVGGEDELPGAKIQ
ncbi:MAG: Cna B-type domain-containing protein, partial [Atopobiaceae bacterium]|nr:Cna B-type domain-containing protein [Atopobiaceae bacterium]